MVVHGTETEKRRSAIARKLALLALLAVPLYVGLWGAIEWILAAASHSGQTRLIRTIMAIVAPLALIVTVGITMTARHQVAARWLLFAVASLALFGTLTNAENLANGSPVWIIAGVGAIVALGASSRRISES